MRRLRLLAGVMLAIAGGLAVPSLAGAETLWQAECRETLRGIPSGNDNDKADAEQAIFNNFGGYTTSWAWGFYNRYDNWHMRQDIIIYRGGATAEAQTNRQVTAYCNDDNHTGQLSSAEDEWRSIFPYP